MKCEKCGEVLEGRMTANSIGHTQGCRDRLAARVAKLESSVTTQVVARPFLDGHWNASPRESARTWSMHCRHFTGGDCFLTGMDTCESLTCSVCGQIWRRPVRDVTLDERDKLHDENVALRAELEATKARLAEAVPLSEARENYDRYRGEVDALRAELAECRAELRRQKDALLESYRIVSGVELDDVPCEGGRPDAATSVVIALHDRVPKWKAAEARAERYRVALVLARAAIDRDRSGMATALDKIKREVRGRSWATEGRGPYEWDDDRYKVEAGVALRAVLVIADDALLASGRLADREVKLIDAALAETEKEKP